MPIPFRTRWNFSSWTNGNIIFLASEVSHHNLNGGLLKIISVLSFMIGVMFVSLIHAKIATRYWRLIALLQSQLVVSLSVSLRVQYLIYLLFRHSHLVWPC